MTMSLFLRGWERFILRERGGDGGKFMHSKVLGVAARAEPRLLGQG